MTGNHYRQGDHYEKRVKADLEANGYAVWQTRQSRSPADLVAIKPGQTLLVQVKAGRTMLSHDEWNALYELGRSAAAVTVVADRAGRSIRYREVLGRHSAHSAIWPCQPWLPDFLR